MCDTSRARRHSLGRTALVVLGALTACRPAMKPDRPLAPSAHEAMLARVNAGPGPEGGLVVLDRARALNDTLKVEGYRLANGLRVLVLEDDAAATFAFQIWYGVGSKHEKEGKTGLAHFFEHLLFRESEGLPEGAFDRIVEMNGGDNNAATWVDWTYYRESLPTGPPSMPEGWTPPPVLRPAPADRLELVVRLEAERMAHMRLSSEQVATERGAVKSERLYRVDNDPEGKMYETLYATAYTEHPYRWPTIGWLADIEGLTRKDCVDFYDTWYAPNNATVVIVGNVRTERALGLVRRWFGALPARDLPTWDVPPEPPQVVERRRTLEMPLNAPKVLVGFHVPAQLHPDHAVLEIANEVLLGGRSSRVHRRLVTEEELATEVSGWVAPFAQPGLFEVMITAKREVSPEAVERALFEEVEALAKEGPSPGEMERARVRLEAELLRELASFGGRAEALGHFETVGGDFGQLFSSVQRWRAPVAEDVRRVVRGYLAPTNRTVVLGLPMSEASSAGDPVEGDEGEGEGEGSPGVEAVDGGPSAVGGPVQSSEGGGPRAAGAPGDVAGATVRPRDVRRVDLANGVHGILVADPTLGLVQLGVTLKIGATEDPEGKAGLARITARMLTRGAGGRTRTEIEEAADALGAELNAGAAHTSLSVEGDTLTRHLDALAALLADVVLRPAFPVEELERLKRETVSEIEGVRDDDQALASRSFRAQVYAGHSYARSALGTVASVRSLSIEDVRSFYDRHFVGGNVVVSAAGDLDAARFAELLEERFGGMRPGASTATSMGPAVRPRGRHLHIVDKPERTQAQIFIGHDAVAASDPDRPALTVLNTAFGGTFTARLMQEIRVERGWSYGAYSRLGADRDAGAFHMWLFPEIADALPAIRRTLELYEVLAREGLTDAEVGFARDHLIGSFAFLHETPGRLADELVRMEVLGLPRDHLDTWRSRILAVSAQEVRRVARERLRPEDLVITVVATAADVRPLLDKLPGVVEVTAAPYDSD